MSSVITVEECPNATNEASFRDRPLVFARRFRFAIAPATSEPTQKRYTGEPATLVASLLLCLSPTTTCLRCAHLLHWSRLWRGLLICQAESMTTRHGHQVLIWRLLSHRRAPSSAQRLSIADRPSEAERPSSRPAG